jgi:hypothetical protein
MDAIQVLFPDLCFNNIRKLISSSECYPFFKGLDNAAEHQLLRLMMMRKCTSNEIMENPTHCLIITKRSETDLLFLNKTWHSF